MCFFNIYKKQNYLKNAYSGVNLQVRGDFVFQNHHYERVLPHNLCIPLWKILEELFSYFISNALQG